MTKELLIDNESLEKKIYQVRGQKVMLDSDLAELYGVETKTGNYSLAGLESVVSIERKSLDDFVGCITAGRDRFEKELSRADSLERFWVVIEANLTAIEKGLYRSRAKPESVLGTLAAWSNRYKVCFMFADNRKSGQKLTERLLKHAWNEYLKRQKSEVCPGSKAV
ncbi:MAG: hypothetical protein GQF41_4323 [Candidatus Rifleibacterium amylolyticum]|nr:MAG: hypothetical protein GQF41_4323 [Candidatus Rifleibacterium amylolyticum]